MPGLRRLTVLGAEYRVRGGTIFTGQLAVHGPLVPVVWHVAAVRIGEHFVQPCGPVMRAGRTKAHRRGALESFPRPRAGHPRRRSRLRDLVRSRAGRSAPLGAGRAGAGRKLGVPLVQIADSRVEFNRSPRPAGHALGRPAGAFHLLVVSQPGVFHKGAGRLTGPRHAWGGEERRGPSPPGAPLAPDPGRHQHAVMRTSAWRPHGVENASQARKSRRLVRQPQLKDNAGTPRSSRSRSCLRARYHRRAVVPSSDGRGLRTASTIVVRAPVPGMGLARAGQRACMASRSCAADVALSRS